MKRFKKIFSAILMFAFGAFVVVGAAHAIDVGDYGVWNTEHNRQLVLENMQHDFDKFYDDAHTSLTGARVPVTAKIGLAFMNAMSMIGERILDNTLIGFVKIFLIIGFLFWVMLETYQMMTKTSQLQNFALEIIKKGALIAIWIIILDFGVARLFMYIVGPILGISTLLSQWILDAVSHTIGGVTTPDTCAAIRAWAATHSASTTIIDAQSAADIMCVPTRLSGFFANGISIGFSWIKASIGHSFLQFLVGIAFVGIFVFNTYKFALMTLGVIADLFLGIFMLPFTAIAETLSKTKYSGLAGNIFNGFLDLFKAESLQVQLQRFIKAAIYFVSLSIVIALCVALLSGTMDPNLAMQTPGYHNTGFAITLLSGLLVTYLATQADKIAKDIGGDINDSIGTQIKQDIKKKWDGTVANTKKLISAIRADKK